MKKILFLGALNTITFGLWCVGGDVINVINNSGKDVAAVYQNVFVSGIQWKKIEPIQDDGWVRWVMVKNGERKEIPVTKQAAMFFIYPDEASPELQKILFAGPRIDPSYNKNKMTLLKELVKKGQGDAKPYLPENDIVMTGNTVQLNKDNTAKINNLPDQKFGKILWNDLRKRYTEKASLYRPSSGGGF